MDWAGFLLGVCGGECTLISGVKVCMVFGTGLGFLVTLSLRLQKFMFSSSPPRVQENRQVFIHYKSGEKIEVDPVKDLSSAFYTHPSRITFPHFPLIR